MGSITEFGLGLKGDVRFANGLGLQAFAAHTPSVSSRQIEYASISYFGLLGLFSPLARLDRSDFLLSAGVGVRRAAGSGISTPDVPPEGVFFEGGPTLGLGWRPSAVIGLEAAYGAMRGARAVISTRWHVFHHPRSGGLNVGLGLAFAWE